ncbi:MAG: transglycosylase SLT domain-containing protein, partial [Gammaproteobacteria bacterium]
ANGNAKLMRFLGSSLQQSSRALATHWRSVIKKPESATQPLLAAAAARAPRGQIEDVLLHGSEIAVRDDPDAAQSLYERLSARLEFTDAARAEAARLLGLAYAYRGRLSALAWFQTYARLTYAADPPIEAHAPTVDWHAVILLSYGRWNELLSLFDRMPGEQSGANRWRYWRARALDELGRDGEARPIFAALATSRGYYGFLSADRIDSSYRIEDQRFEPTAAEAELFATRAGVRRARELYRLGRITEARHEWRALSAGLDDRELAIAARTAKDWGWISNAVVTGARSATLRNDLGVRFPVAFREEISGAAAAQNVDPAWMYAVARQESAFMSDVHSGAGAVGLMQIMPSTGKYIARKSKRKWGGRKSLEDPVTNTTYGSLYLNWMEERFGGRKLLATAAYNAGPSRVNRWLPTARALPADAWVETITINETRKYVQRVMSYMPIYEKHLGLEPSRLRDRMQPVLPR